METSQARVFGSQSRMWSIQQVSCSLRMWHLARQLQICVGDSCPHPSPPLLSPLTLLHSLGDIPHLGY